MAVLDGGSVTLEPELRPAPLQMRPMRPKRPMGSVIHCAVTRALMQSAEDRVASGAQVDIRKYAAAV